MLQEFSLSWQQTEVYKHCLDFLCNSQEPLLVINGVAGSGKTYLIDRLIRRLETNYRVAYVSLTNRVVSARQHEHGWDSSCVFSTFHRLFFHCPIQPDQSIPNRERVFVPKSKSEVQTSMLTLCPTHSMVAELPSLLFIDEGSMLSDSMLELALKVFPGPIIIFGDVNQLPPINSNGNIMDSFDFGLTEIQRNAETSDIIRLSNEIRVTGAYEKRNYHGSQEIDFIPKRKITKDFLQQVDPDIILCGTNRVRRKMNRLMRVAKGTINTVYPQVGELITPDETYSTSVSRGTVLTVEKSACVSDQKTVLTVSDGGTTSPTALPTANEYWLTEDASLLSSETLEGVFLMSFAYAMTVHKCVHPDTLVETETGLVPIRRIPQTGRIATAQGDRPYVDKVSNPPLPSRTITCENGYSVSVTDDHKIECFDGEGWNLKEARDATVGDWMRLKMGCSIEPPELCALPAQSPGLDTPTQCDARVSEFLGLMMADGCVSTEGFRVFKRNRVVADRFSDLCHSLFGVRIAARRDPDSNAWVAELRSTRISDWLLRVGELGSCAKHIPECIMRSPLSVQEAFIRGAFEDDRMTAVHERRHHVQFTSKHEFVCKFIQVALLRVRMVSSVLFRGGHWHVRIHDNPPDRDDSSDWLHVRIQQIDEYVGQSMCVTVPEEGRFLQNGFPHGNSQGSEFDTVLLINDDVSYFLDQRRFMYTAVTRAKQKLIIAE